MRNELGQFVKGFFGSASTQFKKGQVSPRKGVRLSEETKLRISLTKRGLSTKYLDKPKVIRTGWRHSEETKRKISAAHMGMKKPWAGQHIKTPETRAKLSKALIGIPRYDLRGPNHGQWKGGVSSLNTRIRQSVEYKMWRRAVLKRDNWTCQICHTKTRKLHADHIKQFAYYPELRFDISNGRTLCVPCHEKTPTYRAKKQLC